MFQQLVPEGWAQPKGYSNGLVTQGKLIILGGQIGWNAQQEFASDDFVEHTRQTLQNIVDLLAEAGAGLKTSPGLPGSSRIAMPIWRTKRQ